MDNGYGYIDASSGSAGHGSRGGGENEITYILIALAVMLVGGFLFAFFLGRSSADQSPLTKDMQLQGAIQATAIAVVNEARDLQNKSDVAIIDAMAPAIQGQAAAPGMSLSSVANMGDGLIIGLLAICAVVGMFGAIIILGRRGS